MVPSSEDLMDSISTVVCMSAVGAVQGVHERIRVNLVTCPGMSGLAVPQHEAYSESATFEDLQWQGRGGGP